MDDMLMAGVLGVLAFALHIKASIELSDGRSGGMHAWLILGGWVLMAVSSFATCLFKLQSRL